MAYVGGAGETPKQQPAKQLEFNNEQPKTQEAQQNQKTVAPNCVWQVGEHKLPYNAGTVGIFTKLNEQGKPLEEYNDDDMDGSLDFRKTFEYGKYGEVTAVNIDYGNDGQVNQRDEYNENGQIKRSILFGLGGCSSIVAENIYNEKGELTHSMIDENNDGRFDKVKYYGDQPLTKTMESVDSDSGSTSEESIADVKPAT